MGFGEKQKEQPMFKGSVTELKKFHKALVAARKALDGLEECAKELNSIRTGGLTPDRKIGNKYVMRLADVRKAVGSSHELVLRAKEAMEDEFRNPHWKELLAERKGASEADKKEEEPEQPEKAASVEEDQDDVLEIPFPE